MIRKYITSYYVGLGTSLATVGVVLSLIPRSAYSTFKPDDQNRIFVSIRQKNELDPLLLIHKPLLANFCIYNDPTSKQLSRTLQLIVDRRTNNRVNMVDVEADEPGVRDLLPKYMINQIPTIIALRGGIPIDRYSLKTGEKVDESELKRWVDNIGGDIGESQVDGEN